MKKFNANIALFIFAIIFIITGIVGHCFKRLGRTAFDVFADAVRGKIVSAESFIENVDNITSTELSYHSVLMDIDSVRNNLLGTRIIKKDESAIIKSESGSLFEIPDGINDEDMSKIVSLIKELELVSEDNGAEFLYCAAPRKEFYENAPCNISNTSRESYYWFIQELQSAGIPVLDFSGMIERHKATGFEPYYYTDHHWTTRTGFFAAEAICEELSACYGLVFDEEYTDLKNYHVERYLDWFLGSFGKKVGTYFTWHGADDFELIIPNFETSLTEEQPFKNEVREGTFEETVLDMSSMEKDYYGKNTYATYSGGDFRLQIMKNNLSSNGKKILLIRDSFACVVAPFLALQTSELHICDVRNYSYYVGEKLNIEKYMKEIDPDYVLVLYSGISAFKNSAGKYDFF